MAFFGTNKMKRPHKAHSRRALTRKKVWFRLAEHETLKRVYLISLQVQCGHISQEAARHWFECMLPLEMESLTFQAVDAYLANNYVPGVAAGIVKRDPRYLDGLTDTQPVPRGASPPHTGNDYDTADAGAVDFVTRYKTAERLHHMHGAASDNPQVWEANRAF